jgi:protein involved in polysaccharide export with SLBB domain
MKKSLLIGTIIFLSASLSAQVLDGKLNNTSLLNAATISVTIGGDFPVTGSFPAFISERVDQFVTRLYLEARARSVRITDDPKIIKEIEDKLNNFSLRGIILKRSTGEELQLDLLRFRITGDFIYNPYLKNDDVLLFPSYDIKRNFFSVTGSVNNPNIFYYVEGDSLQDAIELAMGINPAYENVNKVAVSRLSYDGVSMSIDTINIDRNTKLERGDRITVIAPETQRKNFYVLVFGEVNNPGKIPITKNDTRLHDVIEAAGGFTEEASLPRSRLYTGNSLAVILERQYGINLDEQPDLENVDLRNTIINLENLQMQRMSNIYQENLSNFLAENQLRVLMEGSSLDFTKINDPNSDIGKYVVKNGDVIVVPILRKSVYIFGQVANPGYVNLAEGKDYNYYINEAGGMGEYAIPDEIMVIKGGSRFWISPIEQQVILEEGDYIYVPKERLISFRTAVAENAIYVGLITSIATVVLLIVTLFK